MCFIVKLLCNVKRLSPRQSLTSRVKDLGAGWGGGVCFLLSVCVFNHYILCITSVLSLHFCQRSVKQQVSIKKCPLPEFFEELITKATESKRAREPRRSSVVPMVNVKFNILISSFGSYTVRKPKKYLSPPSFLPCKSQPMTKMFLLTLLCCVRDDNTRPDQRRRKQRGEEEKSRKKMPVRHQKHKLQRTFIFRQTQLHSFDELQW